MIEGLHSLTVFGGVIVPYFKIPATHRQFVELSARNLAGHRFYFAVNRLQAIDQLLRGCLSRMLFVPKAIRNAFIAVN
jgi:hypothetical protein